MRLLAILTLALCAHMPAFAETMVSGKTWPPAAAVPTISATGTNGAARFVKSAHDVTIGPVIVIGAFRAVETDQGVTVRNLRIDGLVGRDLQRDGIRLRNAIGAEISNFDLRMRAEPQTGDQFPVGITVYAGENITIRDGVVDGFRLSVPAGSFVQGDGIGTERDVKGVRIERVTSRNNGDSGFDLKGQIVGRDLVSERNGNGIKAWHDATISTLTSIDNKRAIHLPVGAKLHIERLVARSVAKAHVIVVEGKGELTIGSCDLTGMAKGSILVQWNGSGAKLKLGTGCAL
ncbi:MAG: hypothetical protein DI527_16500 [Chelatococcus sp.]|nr:MAG: hypothetical protein DI527_16500 [Chelatococcus sp.]